MEPLLAERLGKATSRRRQLFNYRLAHRTKLSQGLTHEGGDAETIASSLPEYLKDVARGGQPLPIDAIGDEGSDSGFSQTSYATSLADLDQCRIPPLPKESSEGSTFMAIYGHIYVWRRIVKLQGESSPGGTSGWNTHAVSVTTRDLDALVYLSQKPMDIKQGIPCPICAEMMRSTSQYQRHVGRHQEQLALFALPTVETDDKDERGGESDSSVESMDMISNQDERGDSNKQPEEPATSYSMLGTDEMTALPVNDLITSMTNGLTEQFIPRDGIDREVITADICRYLENEALVRPGHFENPQNGQVVQGYYISARHVLTTAMIEDLKADSERWDREMQAIASVTPGQFRYQDSPSYGELRNPRFLKGTKGSYQTFGEGTNELINGADKVSSTVPLSRKE
ncbi:hypothetical protein DER44DRAFT_870355 [Fusarium oxysporum]|nr:hypothetical protein DER44DRAFT_870355 [Fusarium oxysporum]